MYERRGSGSCRRKMRKLGVGWPRSPALRGVTACAVCELPWDQATCRRFNRCLPSALFARAEKNGAPQVEREGAAAAAEENGAVVGQPGEDGAPAQGPHSRFSSLFPLLLIGILFYFILLRPERAQQRDHTTLLAGLKKNDKVVTIGGIYGKVFDVQREQDRVILKVDEATNTKLEVTFGSIAHVILEEPSEKDKSTK